MRCLLVAVTIFTAGCLETSSVSCGDGVVCPAGTTCVQLTSPSERMCATSEQLTACSGMPDGTACGTTSACHDGVCLVSVCGNARVDPTEVCDDGNTFPGDGCSGDCRSDETCGNATVDPIRLVAGASELNEECDDGNRISGDGCSATCRRETGRWDQITQPPALAYTGTAYDVDRMRIVMFGGVYVTASNSAIPTEETYEWDGRGWAVVPTNIHPPPRWDARLVYFPPTHEVVMFGGETLVNGNGQLGDMWSWNGERWQLIVPPQLPPARGAFGMVYDAHRKKIVLFGGDGNVADTTYGAYADTWEWDGTTWTEKITANSPTTRSQFAMGYDSKRRVVVVAGGERGVAGPATPETWEYDGTDWRLTGITTPTAFNDANMAFDRVTGKLIAYGGIGPSATTYSYDGTIWSQVAQTTPPGRFGAQLVADPVGSQLVMYGGAFDTSTEDNLTWLWNGSSWSQAETALPADTANFAYAQDPGTGVTWLFGGNFGTAYATDELWSFNGRTWKKHTFTGGPGATGFAAAAFDTAHRQMVMFGGIDTSGALLPANTWLWNGQQWSHPSPAHTPPSLGLPMMAYDAKRQRVVMFGGTDFVTNTYNETYEWDGADWQLMTPATKPPARTASAITYVEGIGVVVGFGEPSMTGADFNDTWAWDGTNWKQLTGSSVILPRHSTTIAVTPIRNHAVMFGGSTSSGGTWHDTWEWDGVTWHSVIAPLHPSNRSAHATFASGMDVFIAGGAGPDNPSLQETWRFRYDSGEPREICSYVTDNDGDGLTGCADPDCWTVCTPVCPPGTSCDPAAPHCGDGVCNDVLENCHICPSDCMCAPACGDASCDGNEMTSCPGDC